MRFRLPTLQHKPEVRLVFYFLTLEDA